MKLCCKTVNVINCSKTHEKMCIIHHPENI